MEKKTQTAMFGHRKKGSEDMNINEKIEKLERTIAVMKSEIEKELAEVKAELEEQVNRKKWKPIYNEKYWYVQGDGVVCSDWWINSRYGINSCTRGRIFRTKAEAEFFAERELVRAELEALADDDKEWNCLLIHWVVSIKYGEPYVTGLAFTKEDVPYFKTQESAQSAIDTVGADRIKKYLFNVKGE